MSDWWGEIEENRKRLLEMRGRTIRVNLTVLVRTSRIFHRNSEALIAHLGQVDAEVLVGGGRFDGMEEYVAEAERLLFNYLAAAQGRIDHMRRLSTYLWSEKSDSGRHYRQIVIEQFDRSPLHKWMIGLRNYVTHQELPVITGRVRRGAHGYSASILLKTDKLLDGHQWDSLARRHIDEHAPAIDVSEAVQAYSKTVTEFDEWVAATYRDDNAEDLAAYDAAKIANGELFRRLTSQFD